MYHYLKLRRCAVQFFENEIYSVERTAKILARSPQTVRKFCRDGELACRKDKGGFFITGWAIREFAEQRLVCTEKIEESK